MPIVLQALEKLHEIGLTVKVMTSDQGSNFISLLHQLEVTVDKPYFEHKGRRIYCMADVPHLLKSTRNCLSRNKIETSTGEAHWSVINEFYTKDKDMKDTRMAPKLKKVHFDLEARGMKMKVKLASQVLSRTVSVGITTYAHFGQLGPHANTTAKFVMNVNNLFDSFNTSRERGVTKYRSAITGKPDDPLLPFLNEMHDWLTSWKILNRENKDITSKFKFRDGWIMNINGVRHLVKELTEEHKFKYLLTRRLCTDPLENLFSIIRSARGLERNPGPAGFTQTLKTTVTNWMLKSEETSNNEAVESTNIMTMGRENMLTFAQDLIGEGFTLSLDQRQEALSATYDILEGQGLQYFSGYIYKTLTRFHPAACETCSAYKGQITSTTTEIAEHEIFTMLKRFEDNRCVLESPSPEFTKFIGDAARILGFCFRHYLGNNSIQKSLQKAVLECPTMPVFCTEEMKNRIVTHLVKTLFFHKLKVINDEIKESGKNSGQSQRKLKILTHQ